MRMIATLIACRRFALLFALSFALMSSRAAIPVFAQEISGRAQLVSGRLEAGETDVYLIRGLQAGDRITVAMRATSGNLDPVTGIMDTVRPLAEVDAAFRADTMRLAAESENIALDLQALR